MGALIWLASYPKSGNTWLRSFLHNLLRNPSESFDINKLSAFTLGESQTHWYTALDPSIAPAFELEDVRRLRPLVHRRMMESSQDSVFVKTHNALVIEAGLPLVSQDMTAGAIYVIRDPRDVVISYSHHLGQSIDDTITLLESEEAWTPGNEKTVYERLTSWSGHVHSWTHTPNPRLHVVRYEDMLNAPIKSFGGIADYLGLKPPRARLERAIKLSSFKVLQAQERRNGFVERSRFTDAFFRKGESGQWKTVLTPEQVARIERAHEVQMRRFRYLT